MKNLPILTGLVWVLTAHAPSAQQASSAGNGLVGTWTLASIEEGIERGEAARVANPRGLLVFDAAGHELEVMTRADRRSLPASSSLSDAQLAFATYSGFWGNYRTDPQQKRIQYRPDGAVNPNLMGKELSRGYDISGDRLTITSLAGEPLTRGITRWTWERVPPVENLSPGYRRVVGFWQHVVEKRVNLATGAQTSETRRAPSVIVYTPSGYVGVHFPPLNRQPFAAEAPTDVEARAALMGYIGYYGALTVYQGMVFHHVLASLGTLQGNTLKRSFELSSDGNEVNLRLAPNANNQGQQTLVTMKRLSGEADMLPRSR